MQGCLADEKLSNLSATQKDELLRKIIANKASTKPQPAARPLTAGTAPLSYAQTPLWLFDKLVPGSSVYNVNIVRRLTGDVDVQLLERSINAIVARHSALRTTLPLVDGQPVQRIAPTLRVPLVIEDLRDAPADLGQNMARTRLDAVSAQPFDLSNGPLLRALLLVLGETDHVLLLSLHHAVSDGGSIRILLRELGAHYDAFAEGRASDLPPLPFQYSDYASWQARALLEPNLKHQFDYWRSRLSDLPTVELPTSRPRPPVQTFNSGRATVTLPPDVSAAIRKMAQDRRVTPFVVLLAAFKLLLARHSGQDDIVVGAPVEGRTRPELEDLIGFFVNSLVLRTDLSGDPTFHELLDRTGETTQGALINQEIPFEHLVKELRPKRDPARTPLFQIYFNAFPSESAGPVSSRLAMKLFETREPRAKFDLTLYAGSLKGNITVTAIYNADLYDAAYMEEIVQQFQTLLDAAVQTPDSPVSVLPLLRAPPPDGVRRNLSVPAVEQAFPKDALETSIHARFAEIARLHPDRAAVVTPLHRWTYSDLDGYGDRICSALLRLLPTGTHRIGLVCENEAPTIAAILGVLKAGFSYVPLDPSHPKERIRYILDDTGATAVLTGGAHADLLRATASPASILVIEEALATPSTGPGPRPPAPDDPAYILYTSGSTGNPKGVVQNHRNVLHHCRTYTNALAISPADRLSVTASFGFDAAVMDIYGALLRGAALYPYNIRTQGLHRLASWLSEEGISVFHSTPTVYRYVLENVGEAEFPTVRAIVLGGEEATRSDFELFKRHFRRGSVLVNGLGPTESTVTLQNFLDHDSSVGRHGIPAGFPVADTEVRIVNQRGMEVGTYAVGEIVICSRHVALGYWRQPEATEKAFAELPAQPGMRLYRTGDLGRRLPCGRIEYAGRNDWQVKIRGQRIDPGEIEVTLRRHPAVRNCVVLAASSAGSTEKRLVAYVVPKSPGVDLEEIRQELKRTLPEYMVPTALVELPGGLPLTANGKLDRRALPPPRPPAGSRRRSQGARNTVEQTILAIWKETLLSDAIDVEDNFFDLGGHSLLMVEVYRKLCTTLGRQFSMIELFRQPTIASLARFLNHDGHACP